MQATLARVTLSELARFPQRPDIEKLFKTAREQPNREIALTWKVSEDTYTLITSLPKLMDDGQMTSTVWIGIPVCSLYKAQADDKWRPLWRYETEDVGFVIAVLDSVNPNPVGDDKPNDVTGLSVEDATKSVEVQVLDEVPFEGELTQTPLASMLRHISRYELSGRLEVLGEGGHGVMYFDAGKIYHAQSEGIVGTDAVMELFLWAAGTFSFVRDSTIDDRNISASIEYLTMEGLTVVDQRRRLEEAGLSMDARLLRSEGIANEAHLQLMLSRGATIPWERQRNVFYKISADVTVGDILRDNPMAMHEWVTLIYNFCACGAVTISPAGEREHSFLASLVDEKKQVEDLRKQFINSLTNLHTYEAFLLELEKEFYRYKYYSWPLSIIIISLKCTETAVLPDQALLNAAMRMHMVKRPLDTAAHFESDDYALLLPNTTGPSAAFVANRLYQAVSSHALAPGIDKSCLIMGFGVYSIHPECSDIEQLLLNAKLLMNQARGKRYPIVMSRYREKNNAGR